MESNKSNFDVCVCALCGIVWTLMAFSNAWTTTSSANYVIRLFVCFVRFFSSFVCVARRQWRDSVPNKWNPFSRFSFVSMRCEWDKRTTTTNRGTELLQLWFGTIEHIDYWYGRQTHAQCKYAHRVPAKNEANGTNSINNKSTTYRIHFVSEFSNNVSPPTTCGACWIRNMLVAWLNSFWRSPSCIHHENLDKRIYAHHTSVSVSHNHFTMQNHRFQFFFLSFFC